MSTLADPADRTALLARDQGFFDALVAGDAAALGDLLAEDFVLVGVADGAVVSGADLLGAVSSGAVRFPAIQAYPDEAIVRRIGEVGIVVGRTAMAFTGVDGTVQSRYTHVFVADPAVGWRLASAQGTPISPTA
jgi:ketosteroid isomerase-like protein